MASTNDPSQPIPIAATGKGPAQPLVAHAYDEKPRLDEKAQGLGEFEPIEVGTVDEYEDEIRESGKSSNPLL